MIRRILALSALSALLFTCHAQSQTPGDVDPRRYHDTAVGPRQCLSAYQVLLLTKCRQAIHECDIVFANLGGNMWLEDIAVKKPISHNFSKKGMIRPFRGLVLHIEQGTEKGTYSWFNCSQAKASAHFGNPKQGDLEQFVDTDDVAWAQVAGNHHWISVENEGKTGESLTWSQIANLANLLGWLHWNEDVPLQLAESPAGSGLGYHAMGGKSWGNHMQCPGQAIIAQRLLIIERAGFWRPLPDPDGVWV